jgi:hypothetical protein
MMPGASEVSISSGVMDDPGFGAGADRPQPTKQLTKKRNIQVRFMGAIL